MKNIIKKKNLITSFIVLLALCLCLIFFSSSNSIQKYETMYKFSPNRNFSQSNKHISVFFNYNISGLYFKNRLTEKGNEKFLDLNIDKLVDSTKKINSFKLRISENVLRNLREIKITSKKKKKFNIKSIDVYKEQDQKKFKVTFESVEKKDTGYYADLIEKIAYDEFYNEILNFNNLIQDNIQLIQTFPDTVDTTFFKNFNDLLEANYSYLINNKDAIHDIIDIEQVSNQKKITARIYISLIEFLSILLSMIFALVLLNFKKISSVIFSER